MRQHRPFHAQAPAWYDVAAQVVDNRQAYPPRLLPSENANAPIKVGFTLAATLAVALAVSNAHAQSLTTLFSFNGQYGNGGNPFGTVSLSGNGSPLYGMSQMGRTRRATACPFLAFR